MAESSQQYLKVNMGPQHPSTHGVLRLELELDGEVVKKCRPVIGYLHTGMEKTMEHRTYVQGVTITDRYDYLNPLGNNLAYALSVEKLFDCSIPERAQVARVLLAELTRLNSHLVSVGSGSIDLGVTSVFLYCLREREKILDLFEEISGQRLMTSYIRPGGLAWDFDDAWLAKAKAFVEEMPGHLDEYEAIVTDNPFFKERTIGVGMLRADDAIRHGVSGPLLKAAGVAHDLRKTNPYSGYETYDFDVPVEHDCDVWARYMVRMRELMESHKIVRQTLERLKPGPVKADAPKVVLPEREAMKTHMDALIHHFLIVAEGFNVPAGEVYHPIEGSKGELGCYVKSDGGPKPARVHFRGPSFVNLSALPHMAEGEMLADVVAIIGSIDIVLGEIDR